MEHELRKAGTRSVKFREILPKLGGLWQILAPSRLFHLLRGACNCIHGRSCTCLRLTNTIVVWIYGNSDAPHRQSCVDRGFRGHHLVGKSRRRIVSDQARVPDQLDDNRHGAGNADYFGAIRRRSRGLRARSYSRPPDPYLPRPSRHQIEPQRLILPRQNLASSFHHEGLVTMRVW
jgi:hypothetical protein